MKKIILVLTVLLFIGCMNRDEYNNPNIEIEDGEVVETIYEEEVEEVYEYDSLANCWVLID